MYRILTEDVNRETIYSILDSYVDGYTVTPSIGSWRGVRENSLAIDFVGVSANKVVAMAEAIRAANDQESVLILEFNTAVQFINRVEVAA